MGEAILSVWDRQREEVLDLKIEWEKSPQIDAKIMVPSRFEKDWKDAVAILRKQLVDDADALSPFPTLPITVKRKDLVSSAWGFYSIASEIWGSEIGWKIAPPAPGFAPETEREGVVQ